MSLEMSSETSSYRNASFSLRCLAGHFRLRGGDGGVISNIYPCCTVFCQSISNTLSKRSEFIVCSAKSAISFPCQEVREDF